MSLSFDSADIGILDYRTELYNCIITSSMEKHSQ